MENEPIAKFEKNSKEDVWIFLSEFAGRKLINIRVHYKDAAGVWKPGKQGIALSVDRYRDLASSMIDLGEHLKSEGLLNK